MRWLAVLLAVLTASCVSPSRTDRDFELKAGNSAKAVASSVATALLGVEAAGRGQATGPYLSVQSQFDSVQPPSVRADAVRATLDEQLSTAVEVLGLLRITVRRGELDRLDDVARPLRPVLLRLRALSEEWQ